MARAPRNVIETAASTALQATAGTQAATTPAKTADAVATRTAPVAQHPWHGDAKQKVYVWDIPSDRSGYNLRIEITEADNADEARIVALEKTLDAGGGEISRPLNAIEVNWINTVEPRVVLDTKEVTLDHKTALDVNQRLEGEIEAWKQCRRDFSRLGINVFNPETWVEGQKAELASKLADAEDDAENKRRALCEAVEAAIGQLTRIARQTDHARPDAVIVAEPDYSVLGIVCPPGVSKRDYPKLAGATWVHTSIDTLTPEQAEGIRLIVKDDGLIDYHVRHTGISDPEANALRAAGALISVSTGVK